MCIELCLSLTDGLYNSLARLAHQFESYAVYPFVHLPARLIVSSLVYFLHEFIFEITLKLFFLLLALEWNVSWIYVGLAFGIALDLEFAFCF